jgi:hypothetical protein
VGAPRRALDFGIEDLSVINAKSATLFAGKKDDDVKILAVGVSKYGPLNDDQITETLRKFGNDVDMTTDDLLKTKQSGDALKSIKQSKHFVISNSRTFLDKIAELELSLVDPKENRDEILDGLDDAEVQLHNLLSSVYTFTETVNQSLRNIDVLVESKHFLQKYEDSVSTAIGLRHCVQHNNTLEIYWVAKYSHQKEMFTHKLGIPLFDVNDPELYRGKVSDASGKKYDPVEYYYGEVDEYLIDVKDLSRIIMSSTEKTYNLLKNQLESGEIEGSEIIKKHNRISKWGENFDINGYKDSG